MSNKCTNPTLESKHTNQCDECTERKAKVKKKIKDYWDKLKAKRTVTVDVEDAKKWVVSIGE